MIWLKELIKAILEWLTGLSREDTKASDADTTPKELKDKWRERIMEAERRIKKSNETSSQTLSGSGD